MYTGTLDGELLRALQDKSSLPRAVRGVASTLVDKLQETLSGRHNSVSFGLCDFRPPLEERPTSHIASPVYPRGLNPVMQTY